MVSEATRGFSDRRSHVNSNRVSDIRPRDKPLDRQRASAMEVIMLRKTMAMFVLATAVALGGTALSTAALARGGGGGGHGGGCGGGHFGGGFGGGHMAGHFGGFHGGHERGEFRHGFGGYGYSTNTGRVGPALVEPQGTVRTVIPLQQGTGRVGPALAEPQGTVRTVIPH